MIQYLLHGLPWMSPSQKSLAKASSDIRIGGIRSAQEGLRQIKDGSVLVFRSVSLQRLGDQLRRDPLTAQLRAKANRTQLTAPAPTFDPGIGELPIVEEFCVDQPLDHAFDHTIVPTGPSQPGPNGRDGAGCGIEIPEGNAQRLLEVVRWGWIHIFVFDGSASEPSFERKDLGMLSDNRQPTAGRMPVQEVAQCAYGPSP